ncbi:peptide/nickel transport system ATP-binding protein [Nitratireductor aquibiodomus]|uniref:Peptide/nickel transport system ATP-binding protein n=1 Tax=Nitratireductor aquibiodomus TaxID=204799 RepID=A0A1H4JRQ7_9HYPH|nr:ABC transporter ATP-binding protein [Nitratireductor aquibiodomus]SEB48837.1 peptide/nickel transport system ATP-binding protein [Nitratireductor aquibiodomus]
MSGGLLSIQSLSLALPEGADRKKALDAVSLDVRPNEIVCLVGESGSGKSMIAHAILDLLPRKVRYLDGDIVFNGKKLTEAPAGEIRRLRGSDLAMIFQEPLTALNPLQRVGEQVAEAIYTHRSDVSAKSISQRVIELFSQVGLPDPAAAVSAFPFQLSGGQRQRVMIAMALANDPALLIADEPTTALDVTTQRQILDLIRSLQAERGMGVLFITHDIGVVADIAHRVVVLRHGKVVEQGTASEILNNPRDAYTRQLMDAIPGRGHVRAGGGEKTALLQISDLRKTFVVKQGLFAKYRRVDAAAGLELSISKGETLAVVGESGSGKSTLARMILRLIDADSGQVLFNGEDVRGMGRVALREYRRRAQIVFQDPYASLDPRLRVGDSIARGPIAFGSPRREAEATARKWLERVGLDASAFDRFPHEFSGGQRQRICIARALALDPEFLIADEAVSALDVSVQAQVLKLLSDLKAQMGLTMLFITHDLRVAREIADRIVVMRNGCIVEDAPAETLFSSPTEDYTRSLLAAVPGRKFFADQDITATGTGIHA